MSSATVKTFETLARPEPKRFLLDERVGVINNIDDFALYKDVKGGLMCPFDPFTAEENAEIAAYVESVIATDEFYWSHTRNGKKTELWQVNSSFLKDDEKNRSIPSCLLTVFYKMNDILVSMTGEHAISASGIRINSNYPIKPHAHRGLSYTIMGPGGTEAFNRATQPREDDIADYNIPLRHMCYFDETIWHRASQSGYSRTSPKVTLIVTPPS